MAVTLAPLVTLDVIFIGFYMLNLLRTFSFLCLMINTIGALGDVWIAVKLLAQNRSILVQDTKNGIEIWSETL